MNATLVKKATTSFAQRGHRYAGTVTTAEPFEIDHVDKAFVNGEESALKAAYDAHGSLVYTYCVRTVGIERAKDVTQEVFVSAWRAREQFRPDKGNLASWLMGIAKNRLIDEIRAEQRHANRRAEAEEGDPITEPEVEQVGDRMLVAQALEVLPERSRTVVELAYLSGLSHQQIAEKTSLPLGTIKSDIRRGLTQMRASLGVTSV